MTRKQFQAKITAVNVKFHELRVEFEKRKLPVKYLERLNSIHRKHLETLNAQLQDDLIKLNRSGKIVLH
jgi:hypothetical protein